MTGADGRLLRIANIVAAIERSGAVSLGLAETCEALAGAPGWEVAILARRCERLDLPARLVSGVADLLLAREFLAADLLIYHFGGWDPLFDALVAGNGRARQAVFVHPLQPVDMAAANERQRAARSFVQLDALRRADRLWPTSPASAALLAARAFDPARIEPFPPEPDGALIRDRIAALLPARPQDAPEFNSPDPAATLRR
ncbi:MAG TPA: hypothetical protein VJ770_26330 [Stellaceae bacterium]|nr:hypothetical protein [Stellaceae bacterium]